MKAHRITPREYFPKEPRADGRFQKRIRGTLYYFGGGGDRDAALSEYERVRDDLYAGRKPRVVAEPSALTMKSLANLFTAEQEARMMAGDISPGHLADYRAALDKFLSFTTGGRLVSDIGPDDFARYRRRLRAALGPHAYNRERACIVAMFNHAADCGWLVNPVNLGRNFQKATAAELRGTRKRRFFQSSDIRKLLKHSDTQMKAMILLGINGGFGATDCSVLQRDDVDLKQRRIDTTRKKRNTVRLVPLWKETCAAIAGVYAERPKDSLVFRHPNGRTWVQDKETANINEITKDFAALVDGLKITRAKGVSFNALRHTFATLANWKQDPDAYKTIMGHKLAGLDDVYVEHIDWQRLKKITDHVHSQIFSGRGNSPSQKPRKQTRV